MDLVREYKNYRKAGMHLNSKIIKTIERDVMMKAAKILDIAKGDTFIFNEEYESDVLMDFIINEQINYDKSTAEVYMQTKGWENDIEKDILNALAASYTSLFRIGSISKSESTLLLQDVLNDSRKVKLIDLGFSQSATTGMLLFTRIVPLEQFNMTSGVSFPFSGDIEEYLLRCYRRLKRKSKAENESTARFASFFELNRTNGLLVKYQKVR